MLYNHKVQQTIKELSDNFEYLHYSTILKYCELSELSKVETLQVYNAIYDKIDYTSRMLNLQNINKI